MEEPPFREAGADGRDFILRKIRTIRPERRGHLDLEIESLRAGSIRPDSLAVFWLYRPQAVFFSFLILARDLTIRYGNELDDGDVLLRLWGPSLGGECSR